MRLILYTSLFTLFIWSCKDNIANIDQTKINTNSIQNSKIEIELSIPHGDSLKYLGLHCEGNPIYVIIHNKTDSIIHFYQDWNSWGYYNTEFEITTYDSIYRIKRGSHVWWKNFPSYYSINPNQSLVLPFNLSDTSCYNINKKVIKGEQPGWIGIPTKGYDYAEIKAIYTVDKNMEHNYFLRDSINYTKMWTGTLISKPISIKIVDSQSY